MNIEIEILDFNQDACIEFKCINPDSTFDQAALSLYTEFTHNILEYARHHTWCLTTSLNELNKWIDNQ